jgi:hypothetical protein
MEFFLPAGNHSVAIQFIQTPIEKLGNIISLTGVIAVYIGIITLRKDIRHGKKTT